MNCKRVSLAFKDGTHANDKRPLSQIWTSFAYQLQVSFQLQRWCSFPIDLNFSFKYHPLQKWGWICTSKIWTESVWDASRSVLGSINNIERARVCELKSLDPDRPLSASARVFWLHPIMFTFWATFEPRLLSQAMQRGILATGQVIDGLLEGVDTAGDITLIDLIPNKLLGSRRTIPCSCDCNIIEPFLQLPLGSFTLMLVRSRWFFYIK